jgi:hypothetical protein
MNLTATLRNVWGHRAGVPKLGIDLRLKSYGLNVLKILSISAEARAANKGNEHEVMKSTNFLGYAVQDMDILGQISMVSEASVTLGLSLLPYQLQKLEEIRKGGDLYLILRFICTAVELASAGAAQPQQFHEVSVQAEGWGTGYCPFKIPQSDWVKILKDLGYGEHLLVEIPLLSVAAKKRLGKALAHLAAARDYFSEGKDEETLSSCYKAFEFLAKQAGGTHPDQNGFEKVLKDVNDPDKRRRLKQLLHETCSFLNLGRHEPGPERTTLDRRDAEYALILSYASFSYLAKLVP